MYSKLVCGMAKCGQTTKMRKYIMEAVEHNSSLNKEALQTVAQYFGEGHYVSEMKLLRENQKHQKRMVKTERNTQFKNNYNEENPKRFKEMIREQKE